MSPFILVVLFLLSLPIDATRLYAGSESSGGGDEVYPDENVMWFQRAGDVHYCIKQHPNFGINEEETSSLIDLVIKTWLTYAKERDHSFYQWVEGDRNVNQPLFQNRWLRGDCTDTTDLIFYLGSSTAAIDQARLKYQKPVAFAERLRQPQDPLWHRGFIWLAAAHTVRAENAFPDWDPPQHFLGMILHELGHVFGVSHMEGTIMTKNIAKMLTKAKDRLLDFRRIKNLESIDHSRALITCSDCPMEGRGTLFPSTALAALLERKLQDSSSFILQQKALDSKTIQGEIVLTNEQGSFQYSYTLDQSTTIYFPGSIDIFKRLQRYRASRGNLDEWYVGEKEKGLSIRGLLQAKGAQKAYPIVLSMNYGSPLDQRVPDYNVRSHELLIFVDGKQLRLQF